MWYPILKNVEYCQSAQSYKARFSSSGDLFPAYLICVEWLWAVSFGWYTGSWPGVPHGKKTPLMDGLCSFLPTQLGFQFGNQSPLMYREGPCSSSTPHHHLKPQRVVASWHSWGQVDWCSDAKETVLCIHIFRFNVTVFIEDSLHFETWKMSTFRSLSISATILFSRWACYLAQAHLWLPRCVWVCVCVKQGLVTMNKFM